jgi:MFS family permease
MFTTRSLKQLNIPRREFFQILVLVFYALTWYYMTLSLLRNVSVHLELTNTEFLLVSSVLHTAIAGSSMIGAILFSRANRIRLLYSWMLVGVVSSLFPALINIDTMSLAISTFLCFGIIYGLGLPSCLSYFAEHTSIDNRGRISGLISLTIFLGFLPSAIMFGAFDLRTNHLLSAIWKTSGLILFWLLKPKETKISPKMTKQKSFAAIINNRSFLFYLIPWFIFWLVDRSEESLLRAFVVNLFGSEFEAVLRLLGLVFGGLFALIGGVMSDLVGRKRVVIGGFIALGLGYATIGLAPTHLLSWYFWIIADGAAWGMFFSVFILVLWGDLSSSGGSEKYYVLGNLPLFITSAFQLFSDPSITSVSATSAFSLAALFLFLAVLPLMYASETLPAKKIRLRQLQSYVEKAKKLSEKHGRKT